MRQAGRTALIVLALACVALALWAAPAQAERFQGQGKQAIVGGDTAAAQRAATKLAKIDALLTAVSSVMSQEQFETDKARITRFVTQDPDRWIALFEVLDEGASGADFTVRLSCDVRMVALRVALDQELGGARNGQADAPDLSKPGPVLVLIVDRSGSAPRQVWELHQPIEIALSAAGYAVLERETQAKALQSSGLDDALHGDVRKFCSVARALGAIYVMIGLVSGNIADSEGVSCIKEVQVRFVHAPACRVISGLSANPGGLEGPCAQRMELVGQALVNRVIQDQHKAAQEQGQGVLVEASGLRHYDDYLELAQALGQVPGVTNVSLEYAIKGQRFGLRLAGGVNAELLGAALDKVVMPHFRISLQGVEGNRVSIKCAY